MASLLSVEADVWQAEVNVRFKLIAMGQNEARWRLSWIRSNLLKACGYLERKGWLEGAVIVIDEPEKIGERRVDV